MTLPGSSDILPTVASERADFVEGIIAAHTIAGDRDKAPFQAIAKAVIGGEYQGFCKVVAHAETSARYWACISSGRMLRTLSPSRPSG